MLGFPKAGGDSRRGTVVLARNGMVAAAHPLIVATGIEVLRCGGNAVDAAVACGLTAAVVMPEMCGLGGDLFAIVHAPGQAAATVLGAGVSPRAASLEQMRKAGPQTPHGPKMPTTGPLSIGVPGMVSGYEALLARFGSKTLAELTRSAIRYADEGIAVMPKHVANVIDKKALLAAFPTSSAIFLKAGQPPQVGDILRQPDLARTLRRIGEEGADGFYKGDVGRRIGEAITSAGGALSADDLAQHQTVWAAPISVRYRDYIIHQTAPPSQGLIHLEAMNIVEQADPAVLAKGDAEAIHVEAEALRLAYEDRIAYAVEPGFGSTPMDTLLSKDWAARRYAKIGPKAAAEATAASLSDGDTTYLCVIDGQGMMVSLIQSVSSPFGSGVVAGDTGVLLNNRAGRGFSLDEGHPNIFAPGKKTISTLNLYSVSDASGVPVMVGGTPGGDGQPQWNLQALVGMIDGGLDVQQATEVTRWSIWPGTDPANRPNPYELQVEDQLGEETIAGLEARGHPVKRLGAWGAMGAAQIIARDPATGVLAGGSDPRVEGMALGF